jgi:hypothetical protein
MGAVQRYELADIHGGGHVMLGSDTGDLVYYDDHADAVRRLEEAVELLGHMWKCETQVNLFAKLPDNDSRKEKTGCNFDAAYQRVLENDIARAAIERERGEDPLNRKASK